MVGAAGAGGQISVRALAAQAGITPSSIYCYFKEMEHLFEDAQLRAMEDARRGALCCDRRSRAWGWQVNCLRRRLAHFSPQ
jgi:AcrR family transcriptional regulator